MSTDDRERNESTRRILEDTMRASYGRVLSVLIRDLGDFDLAEDALQDAWLDALRSWPRDGEPHNPPGWLVATARRRALDRLRRRRRGDALADALTTELITADVDPLEWADSIGDERLRLIFTCCHPALAPAARVALTLRTVAGLSTREIARAFGVQESTMQQRIVRAKQRIATAGIPYRVPESAELPDRLPSVHSVIYAVFTEGYAATEHTDYLRRDLTGEAIRLAELLDALLPGCAETIGLRALMLLHDARRSSRQLDDGQLVLLEDQNRTRWDQRQIGQAVDLLDAALAVNEPGPYQIQAAIAALHADADSVDDTDWPQIAALYTSLTAVWSSPLARLAAAVAHGMADGPDVGLRRLDDLRDQLGTDHRWHAAVAHMCLLADRPADAADAFRTGADAASHPIEAERLRRRARDAVRPAR